MDIRKMLSDLTELSGPSGFEAGVANKAAELMTPFVDQASVDRFGNAVGVRLCGKAGAPRLLLDAHLDEIGMMVTGIEEGFLRFRPIGGVDPRMLPNREVTIMTQPPLLGVVACLPPHVLKEGEGNKSIPIEDLWIDTGFSQERAEALIPIGTPMVFRQTITALKGDKLAGKAMDDRACFVILLRTLELLKDKPLDVDVYVMGSTREEIGGGGARVGTYGINPHCCVAVDVTHAKTPDCPQNRRSVLGGGAQIGVGPNMTPWMTQRMLDKAKELELPHKIEVMGGHTGTNGWGMQITREGVATSVVSLPLKYMHTPIETLDLADIEHIARLLVAFTLNLAKEVDVL